MSLIRSPFELHSWVTFVRYIYESDRANWERHWKKYAEGHETEEMTNAIWARINNQEVLFPVYGLIAQTKNNTLGILHARLKQGTFSPKPWLYIEDLYLDSQAQREVAISSKNWEVSSIAALFHTAVIELVRSENLDISGIEFDTDEKNLVARRVYSKRIGVWDGAESHRRIYKADASQIQQRIKALDGLISDGKISVISESEK